MLLTAPGVRVTEYNLLKSALLGGGQRVGGCVGLLRQRSEMLPGTRGSVTDAGTVAGVDVPSTISFATGNAKKLKEVELLYTCQPRQSPRQCSVCLLKCTVEVTTIPELFSSAFRPSDSAVAVLSVKVPQMAHARAYWMWRQVISRTISTGMEFPMFM